MIKKLSKYGNSHALVIDKALLEILNITDTTKLKLSTDGTSLTVTPLKTEKIETPAISVAEGETELHYFADNITAFKKATAENPNLLTPEIFAKRSAMVNEECLKQGIPTSQEMDFLMTQMIKSPEYKTKIKELNVKARTQNLSSQEYGEAQLALMEEVNPELFEKIKLHNEISAKIWGEIAPSKKTK